MPYTSIKTIDNRTYLVNGIDAKLINTIQSYMNFTIQVIEWENNWGEKLEDNSWNGLLGIINNEINFYTNCKVMFEQANIFDNYLAS